MLKRDVTRVRSVGAEGQLSPPASSREAPGLVWPRAQEADLLLSAQTWDQQSLPQSPIGGDTALQPHRLCDLGKFLASFIYSNGNERKLLNGDPGGKTSKRSSSARLSPAR